MVIATIVVAVIGVVVLVALLGVVAYCTVCKKEKVEVEHDKLPETFQTSMSDIVPDQPATMSDNTQNDKEEI